MIKCFLIIVTIVVLPEALKANPRSLQKRQTDPCISTGTTGSISGHWGDWGDWQDCNGGYAIEFMVRYETCDDCDDTALNAICLVCNNGRTVCSKQSYWGDWYNSQSCGDGFTGFNLKVEGKQGSDDDTAANDVKLWCPSQQTWIAANNPARWGQYQGQTYCPGGTKICGIRTRVEESCGGDCDDTALNGVQFRCCPLDC
jgi:hypothetical protein